MDAVSLHTQTSTTPAHAVALIIIEASDQLSHERLHELVGLSLPQLARFRSRVVGKPLGLGQPVWAEIDDYDPTPQIHSATVRCSRWPPGVRRPDRGADHRAAGSPQTAVGSVEHRRSGGRPVGVGGEDVAGNKRWRRRGGLRLAAATDYWSAGRPDQLSAGRAEPGQAALHRRARYRHHAGAPGEPSHRRLADRRGRAWCAAGRGAAGCAARAGPTSCRPRRRRCAGRCRAQCSTRR